MALYALDDVDDAYAITRAFLTSIDRTTWLKLALVVFFVGGAGASFPQANFSGGDTVTDPGTPPAEEFPTFDPGPDFWLWAGLLALAVVAVLLALTFVGAVMEFVFVESLRTEVVSVREYWGRHWRKGARLFGFRLVVDLLAVAPFLVLAALFLVPLVFDTAAFPVSGLLFVALIPVLLVVVVLAGLVQGFTTNFVVPIMILEDRGVLAGWRRLWPTVRAQWKQYLAYAVASWVLAIVGGIVAFVVTAILAIALFIPFGVLFAVGIGLLMVLQVAGVVWLVVTGLLFALAALVLGTLVQVPVQTYLRYYALLVLGDVEEAFDIIPEQRTLARSDVDEAP